jgi:hypothetical protein
MDNHFLDQLVQKPTGRVSDPNCLADGVAMPLRILGHLSALSVDELWLYATTPYQSLTTCAVVAASDFNEVTLMKLWTEATGTGLSLGISSDRKTLAVGAPARSFKCIIASLAQVRFSEGDWSQIGSGIDSERRYREEDNWATDFVAISGNEKRLVVGGPLPEPNWSDVLVSCPDFSNKLVGSIRVFDLGLAPMPPSTQPTLAPNSDPTPSNTAPTAQPTTSPTLAPSESGDTLAALPSVALTRGLPFGYVGVLVIGTFLLHL